MIFKSHLKYILIIRYVHSEVIIGENLMTEEFYYAILLKGEFEEIYNMMFLGQAFRSWLRVVKYKQQPV